MREIIEGAMAFCVGNLGYLAAFMLALLPLLFILYLMGQ
jgi:hypothetical protein